MSKKKIILTIIFLLVAMFILWSDIKFTYKTRNLIFWTQNPETKIEDFEMNPDKNSKKNLHFWNGIALRSTFMHDAKAYAIFDKSQSWSKDTSTYNYREELKIQKLSFDLAEVYARRMNKKIKSMKYANYGITPDYETLEKNCYPIYKSYEKKNDLLLNFNGKSSSEVIKIWRPMIDEMLELEE